MLRHGKKAAAKRQALGIDGMWDAGRYVPLHKNARPPEHSGCREKGLDRDHRVGVAVNKQHRRRAGGEVGQGFGRRKHSGVADDGSRARGPAKTDMQRKHGAWLNPTSMSLSGASPRRESSA